MKTWIFDEEKRDRAIDVWVQSQIDTGHPAAQKNARFVGEAIKDMLDTSPTLFTVSKESKDDYREPVKPVVDPTPPPKTSEVVDVEPADVKPKSKPLSVAELKDQFYSMDQ